MAEKTRYSDAELEEFRAIIMEKLELAQRDYDRLKSSIMNKDGNDTDDTSPTYPVGGTSAEVYPRIAGGTDTYRK